MLLALCVVFRGGATQASTQGVAGDRILSRLASSNANERDAAEKELGRREPGPWLDRLLEAASGAAPELRKRLVRGLGSGRGLIGALASRFRHAEEPREIALLADAFAAHYRRHAATGPMDPESMQVLPVQTLDLRAVRSMIDAVDQCQIAGMLPLPVLVDPLLDRRAGIARRSLDGLGGGARVLRELLPGLESAGASTAMLVTRIRSRGVLVELRSGPGSMGAAFARSFAYFLRGMSPASIADRAAIDLGTLDLLSVQEAVLSLTKDPDSALARRARLLLAAASLRGWRHDSQSELAAPWFEDFQRAIGDSERWASQLYLGHAVRLMLTNRRRPDELPAWFGDWSALTNPAKLVLIAGVPGRKFGRQARDLLIERKPTGLPRYCLLYLLRRQLPSGCESLIPSWQRRILQVPETETTMILRERDLLIELVQATGTSCLPKRMVHLDAPFGTVKRGRTLARAIGAEGKEGIELILRSLGRARAIEPGLFGLLRVARAPAARGVGGRPRAWFLASLERERVKASPQGALMLDLLLGEVGPLSVRNSTVRERLVSCFQRLMQYLPSTRKDGIWKDEALAGLLDEALGRTFARLLLALPRPPDGVAIARRLESWLAKEATRRLGLAACSLALTERSILFGDLARLLQRSRARGLDLPARLSLLRQIEQMARARPQSLGWAPLDPLDPLLLPKMRD